MPNMTQTIRELRAAVSTAIPCDRDLLAAYVAGDATTFELLVQRHASMVRAACLRVLGNEHEADDAFQATFLVLAAKAAQVRWQSSAASWLYEVARRTASKLRAQQAVRRRHEQRASKNEAVTDHDRCRYELNALLDKELERLPARLREPLVLCYLAGRTRGQAARELGYSLATLKLRLQQGRRYLRCRLEKHGLASATVLGGWLVQPAPAVASALVRDTVRSVHGNSAPAVILNLAKGVSITMTLNQFLRRVSLVVTCVAAGLGLLAACHALTVPEAQPTPMPSSVQAHRAVPLPASKPAENPTTLYQTILAEQRSLRKQFLVFQQSALRLAQRLENGPLVEDQRVAAKLKEILEKATQIDRQQNELLDLLVKQADPTLEGLTVARAQSDLLAVEFARLGSLFGARKLRENRAERGERPDKRTLDAARRHIDNERWADACQALQDIINVDPEVFVPAGDADMVRLAEHAQQLLAKLPARGREVYQLRYGPLARKQFEEAKKNEDFLALLEVQRRFRYIKDVPDQAAQTVDANHVWKLAASLVRIVENQQLQSGRLERCRTLQSDNILDDILQP
ncbi:MAG: RNA polymerase sigma factor [Gemmataceae bacterium]